MKDLKVQFHKISPHLSKFYEFYFKEISIQNNLDIESFFYPVKLRDSFSKKKYGGLNYGFYKRLFQSKVFLEHSLLFLQKFLDTYKEEVASKVKNLLIKWDLALQDSKMDPKNVENRFFCYLTNNKRCKFPLSLKEAEEAIQKFTQFILDANRKRKI